MGDVPDKRSQSATGIRHILGSEEGRA